MLKQELWQFPEHISNLSRMAANQKVTAELLDWLLAVTAE